MFDHVAHSFIATLQFEENPINTLDSMTTGPVVLTSLKGGPVHSIEGPLRSPCWMAAMKTGGTVRR